MTPGPEYDLVLRLLSDRGAAASRALRHRRDLERVAVPSQRRVRNAPRFTGRPLHSVAQALRVLAGILDGERRLRHA